MLTPSEIDHVQKLLFLMRFHAHDLEETTRTMNPRTTRGRAIRKRAERVAECYRRGMALYGERLTVESAWTIQRLHDAMWTSVPLSKL